MNVNATNERHIQKKKKQNNLKNGLFFELKTWFTMMIFYDFIA